MDLGLSNAVAIVTGASRGIGLAVTRELVANGAQVIAGARRSSEGLDELVEAGAVEFVATDLSSPEGVDALVTAAGRREHVDVLVNNVGGVTPRPDGFASVTDEEWLAAFTINVLTPVRMLRAVLPFMLDAGRGSIVTVSSVNAFLPDPLVIDYSAAKAALANLSKSLSKEVGGRGIRVNTVSPGPVATDLWLGEGGVAQTVARATGADPAAVAAGAAGGAVTGRFTRPDEVARLICFLASDAASNLTGADVTIDGGLITTL